MRTHAVQTSFLTGVLDPRAIARVETESYNNALLEGENVIPSHLGGVKRRPGLAYRATLPNKLVQITQGTFSQPTLGSVNDGSEITVGYRDIGSPTDPEFVAVQLDLGAALDVYAADTLGMYLSTGSTTEFCVQYSLDAATWTTLGDFFETVDYLAPRSYRRVGPVLARHWRVVKIGGTDVGAIRANVGEFRLWGDTGEISAARVLPFEVSAADRYAVVLTDRTAQVFAGGVLVETLPMPFTSEDLAEVDAAADAESMILTHEDYPQRLLVREDTDFFQTQQIVFDSVPEFDYADTQSPVPVTCIQVLTFVGSWPRGTTFQLELEGAQTAAIRWHGDTTAEERLSQEADIQREVQKLYTVKGFTGVSCTRTGAGVYTVALGEASAGNYRLMSGSSLTDTGTISVALSQAGSPRTEDVWSATRGYSRSVAFHEGRLYFGGAKGRQQTLFGSRVASILEFKADEGLEDDPLEVTFVGQQLNAINGLFSGRQLQIFTTGSEYRFAKQQGQAIVPGDAPAFQTGYGSAKIRPVSLDGSTMFVQRNRKSLRDFKYRYEEDAYDSLGTSSLAPHLLNDVVDLFAWKGHRQDDIGLVFLVNGDGTVAVLNSRKEANVQAWCRWTTDGAFVAGTAVLEDIYFVVRRTVGGSEHNFLETVDFSRYLDSSVTASGDALTSVSGLGHLEGAECRVRADGFVQSNGTVSAGAVALEEAADEAEVGLGWQVTVTPMPLQTLLPTGSNFMRRRRIVKLRVRVRDTLGLMANGRVLADRQFDVDEFDAAAEPFTGSLSLEETTNWDEDQDKIVRFTQDDPLPMELLGIDVTLEVAE